MKNKELVEFLESNFKSTDKVTMVLNMGKGGVVEKCYHSATWTSPEDNEYDYTCTSLNYWKRSNIEVGFWDVEELIDLLKLKNVNELSNKDIHDMTLGDSSDGYVEIENLKWDGKKPKKRELDELDNMQLYDGNIDDSELEFDAGSIELMEVTISKKHHINIQYDGKYEVNLGPRITEWTVADKKKYERKYKAAMKTLKELAEEYNLILEAEITENLPKFEKYDFEGPVYGNGETYVYVENTRDWREKEVVELEVETEVGTTMKFQFNDLLQLIALRNNITKAVDKFDRGYFDKQVVDNAWEPVKEDDFSFTDSDFESSDDDTDDDDDNFVSNEY